MYITSKITIHKSTPIELMYTSVELFKISNHLRTEPNYALNKYNTSTFSSKRDTTPNHTVFIQQPPSPIYDGRALQKFKRQHPWLYTYNPGYAAQLPCGDYALT